MEKIRRIRKQRVYMQRYRKRLSKTGRCYLSVVVKKQTRIKLIRIKGRKPHLSQGRIVDLAVEAYYTHNLQVRGNACR